MKSSKPNKKALLKFLARFYDCLDRPIDMEFLKKKIDERWPDKPKTK